MYVRGQKMSFLTLRFQDDVLEKDYFEVYFRKTIGHVRFSLIVGIFLYLIFGVLDGVVIPEAKAQAWFIRYVVVAPYLGLFFALSFSRHFKKIMQAGAVFLILLAGFGIIAMLVLSKPPGSHLYYAGLILVIMFSYTFLKLRFIYGTFASWVLVAGYAAAAGRSAAVNLPMMVNNLFFLVSANFIGMFASYQMELYVRKDYLQSRRLRAFEEKKHLLEKEKILKDLHDGVGGIATSIALLAETARSEASIEEVRKTLGSIFELSRESLTEIRGFMQSLDVRELDWESLIADLRHLGNNLLEARGIRFSLTASYADAQGRPDTLLYLNLFRIYKEAITNIVKHAGASVVHVIMDIAQERLLLSVEDNGQGLRQERTGGRGMASMRDRARDLGGSLSVQTGQGTRIVAEVPLPGKYLTSGMEIPSPS